MDRAYDPLLEAWASRPHHAGQVFVSDGVIDQKRFVSASRRILFLLKEAHGGNESWDLRACVREKWGDKLGGSLWTAAYWAYAAQRVTSTFVPEIPSDPGQPPLALEALLGTAVVNIKKSRGQRSSEVTDLDEYVRRDGDLILRQIESIDPHLVICGGTWINIHKPLFPGAQYMFDMVWKVEGRIVIDFWHPGYRVDHQLTYYALACLLQRSAAWLPQVFGSQQAERPGAAPAAQRERSADSTRHSRRMTTTDHGSK